MKVSVRLTNRFAHFIEPYPYEDLLPYFSFYPQGYRFMPSYRRGQWDGKIRMLKYHKTATGLFLALRPKLEEELGVEFDITKEFEKVKFGEGISSDRPFQNECVEKMVKAANRWGGGLVLGATGTGKTYITAMFFSRLKGTGVFIVDELTLLDQARKEMQSVMNERVGMIGQSRFEPDRITVATVQTLNLHKNDERFVEWAQYLQVMIIDELHQAMAKRNFAVVEDIRPAAVFGLTATLQLSQKPVRLKAHALTGPVVFEYPLAQGQQEGYLSKGVVMQVEHLGAWDEEEDYQTDYRKCIVEDDQRNDLICDLVGLAIKRKKYVIVLVERIKHLEILSGLLQNTPHRVVCGMKSVEQRIAAKRQFEKGKIRLILANKVFKKGIDIKRLDVVIDAAAMKSKNDARQKFGRGVRLHPDKTGLLYFDIGDVGNRFEKAAKSRRISLKGLGVPVKKEYAGDANENVEFIFARAEKLLTATILQK